MTQNVWWLFFNGIVVNCLSLPDTCLVELVKSCASCSSYFTCLQMAAGLVQSCPSNGYVMDTAHPNVEQNGSSCKPESVADSQDCLLPWSACQLWWALQSLRPRSMDKARGLRCPRVLHDTKKIHGWTIGRTIKGPFWSFKATSCCIPVCNLVSRLFEDVWTVFCFVHNYPLVN